MILAILLMAVAVLLLERHILAVAPPRAPRQPERRWKPLPGGYPRIWPMGPDGPQTNPRMRVRYIAGL
jgi:hypothetical protein